MAMFSKKKGIIPPLKKLGDHQLMKFVNEKNPEAFEEFYDRFSSNVYSLSLHITKSPQQAEDVTQEAFLSVWKSNAEYQSSKGTPKSWILQIAKNRSLDQLRRIGTRPQYSELDQETIPSEVVTLPQISERREQAEVVKEALKELPSEQSEVIFLAFYQGMSQSEIADKLDSPLGTVKGRMRQGLKKLRDHSEIGELYES